MVSNTVLSSYRFWKTHPYRNHLDPPRLLQLNSCFLLEDVRDNIYPNIYRKIYPVITITKSVHELLHVLEFFVTAVRFSVVGSRPCYKLQGAGLYFALYCLKLYLLLSQPRRHKRKPRRVWHNWRYRKIANGLFYWQNNGCIINATRLEYNTAGADVAYKDKASACGCIRTVSWQLILVMSRNLHNGTGLAI